LERILVIRLSAIGDVLLTTPLVRILKKKFPQAEIDFLVKKSYRTLLSTNKNINMIWSLSPEDGFYEMIRLSRKLREKRYDCVIDLQVNLRSIFFCFFSGAKRRIIHRPQRFKRFLLVHFRKNIYKEIEPVPLRFLNSVFSLGLKDDGLGLELKVDERARQSIPLLLQKAKNGGKRRIIVLAPGAGRATKRWFPERFAEVGSYFGKNRNQIVLVGGQKDLEVCRKVAQEMDPAPLNFAGKLSLQQTAAVLKESDILITNDTGIMHIAAALEVKVVAIFGPTTRHFGFMPFRTSSIVVEASVPCRPCSYHGTDKCPHNHFKCMKDIRSIDVIQAAEELLRRE